MVDISLYFQVHQTNKLRNYRIYDIGKNQDYFDVRAIEDVINKVGFESYFELNKMLLSLIEKGDLNLKINFSISGIVIEQMAKYAPTVLNSFIELSKTGCVEFLIEPYYNSLSSIYSEDEFIFQVNKHKETVEKYFGKKNVSSVVKNTELIYSNDLAKVFEKTGAKGILVNGSTRLLKGANPNEIFKAKDSKLKILVRNYEVSKSLRKLNDILSVNNFTDLCFSQAGEVLNLFVDYDSFEKQNIQYLGDFIEKISGYSNFKFASDLIKLKSLEELDVPFVTSWNKCNTINHLLGNRLQESAQEELYAIEGVLKKFDDESLLENWRKLTCANHFFYMNVKDHFDGEICNCYKSPYDVYVYFMNILNDLILRIKLKEEKIKLEQEMNLVSSKKIDADNLKSIITS